MNVKQKKSILFLSTLDFKEKSIQVIRKTPEAYIEAGWDVNYIVVRDNTKYDNYYYEKEINIQGMNTKRVYLPMQSIINKYGTNRILRRFLQKIAYFFATIKLYKLSKKILKEKNITIIYGYEVHGVLAANLLKWTGKIKGKKIISRFQGTFGSYYYDNKLFLKMISNSDHYLAQYLSSDLCIMTNDGTQGNRALQIIKSKNLRNYRFWVNGVDEQKLNIETISDLKKKLNPSEDFLFITVCRLEKWKRVDRSILALSFLKNKLGIVNFKYIIVGEGVEKNNLIQLAKENNLINHIHFTGAVPNIEVKQFLNCADAFLSTYDTSNVGNPLLEAIRCNKIIFTLNNGDTKYWIQHKKNGFIYDINENLYKNMAYDFSLLISDTNLREKIIKNIATTEKEKLWTWKERMKAEISEVERLLK